MYFLYMQRYFLSSLCLILNYNSVKQYYSIMVLNLIIFKSEQMINKQLTTANHAWSFHSNPSHNRREVSASRSHGGPSKDPP